MKSVAAPTKKQLDREVAARIADQLLEDSGPDLDSLIDRMLTLTPNSRPPSDMTPEGSDAEGGDHGEETVQSVGDSGETTEGSEDAPPELPPKQRPLGSHPNGDLLHLAENGGVPLPNDAPPPVVPPRKKMNKEKESDTVRVPFSTRDTLDTTLCRGPAV